jgi:PAS domain S-box-containing protein
MSDTSAGSDRRKAGQIVGIVAATIVAGAFLTGRSGVSPSTARLLDNVHWTTSYTAAAVLAWLGAWRAGAAERVPRRWFAWGLSSYAVGQVLWDLQVLSGWNPFPAPSDLFYLALGPCGVLGLLAHLRAQTARAQLRVVLLDTAGLAVAALALTLALYLPRRGQTGATQLAFMVAYPLGMLAAACVALVMVPILKLRLDWRWGMFLGANLVNGFIWMHWNTLTLDGRLEDGSWYNLTFSPVALLLGVGAMNWRATRRTDPHWERACEGLLRLLPILMVTAGAAAVLLAWLLPGVPRGVQVSVGLGALITFAVGVARQSLLLSERDRLLEAEQQWHESELKVRTERQKAELALRAESAFRESIIDHAAEGLCVCEATHQLPLVCFTVWNQRMQEITGYTLEEINRLGWYQTMYPDPALRQVAMDRMKRMRQGDELRGEDWEVQRADGARRVLRVTTTSIEPAEGRVHVLALMDDITDVLQAEEARRDLEGQLRQAQKMESIGTLAGGVAHDFNNILAAIQGNVELARMDVGPGHPATSSLEEILKASQRAKNLVKQILAFSRQESLPEKRGIDLGAVIEEAAGLLRASLPAGVSLTVERDGQVPNILGDSNQLHQVLLNLCTNSWHALEGQPGRIDIQARAVTVGEDAARGHPELRAGRYAKVSVTDTGHGIKPDVLERIFDPFYTTKEPGKGTGLGLAVVHGIVKEHQGAIVVKSQPGSGACFEIYLPAADGTSPFSQSATPSPRAGRGERVLFVDDEEALVLLATRVLERLNYRPKGFSRAHQALATFRAQPDAFDVVVTDYNMPGMSGLDVAREILAIRPDIPIVLASGYITDELRARSAAAKVYQLVYKPNTVEELCRAVHEAVSNLAGLRRLAASR